MILEPGASLLVIRNGAAEVRECFGYANLEERIPATPSTNYRLASVTKQFTAATILILGLPLDASVRRWLPIDASITIHHLLTHTSGLRDYEDLIPENTTAQLRDIDVLRILETEPLDFTPGSHYRYSNGGYALLALIAERAAGRSFADLLRDLIFAPLGMTNTVAFEDGISTVANRAYGYARENGVWTRADQSLTSAVLGDGGIYSSIDDLAKWDAALYDDARLQIAFAPSTPTDDPNIQYGFGWRITEDLVWHSGETRGFRNMIVRDPTHRMTTILLSNRE